ncbi:MAG: ATP-binding protein [Bacteroidetes bacterium]|nr:ATP-binding protein [Rhodothermia bacterium]MCS7155285.1 ATP-binding protein [Bacteroidota bacterium]MCX7907870.1 ATP-binding protein [Bacteroidota bacterium]MDW8138689.1 ATP-binding protein [Bacteroidota bacterium]MDW8284725.1 ATP-binding protein [Bacteroidota bacterium]
MRFHNLETITEELLDQFAHWLAQPDGLMRVLGEEGLLKLRLIVHEWVANLVEHAVFNGKGPEIVLEFETTEPRGVCCRIYDNSLGFDWDRCAQQSAALDDLEAERGRGLAFIQALSKRVLYQSREGWNCFQVWVEG